MKLLARDPVSGQRPFTELRAPEIEFQNQGVKQPPAFKKGALASGWKTCPYVNLKERLQFVRNQKVPPALGTVERIYLRNSMDRT